MGGDPCPLRIKTYFTSNDKWNSDPYRTESEEWPGRQAWWPSLVLPRESEGWVWDCLPAIMGTQGSRCFAKQAQQTRTVYDKQIWSSFYWPSMFLNQIYCHYTKSAYIREDLLNPFFKQTKHKVYTFIAINLVIGAGMLRKQYTRPLKQYRQISPLIFP